MNDWLKFMFACATNPAMAQTVAISLLWRPEDWATGKGNNPRAVEQAKRDSRAMG